MRISHILYCFFSYLVILEPFGLVQTLFVLLWAMFLISVQLLKLLLCGLISTNAQFMGESRILEGSYSELGNLLPALSSPGLPQTLQPTKPHIFGSPGQKDRSSIRDFAANGTDATNAKELSNLGLPWGKSHEKSKKWETHPLNGSFFLFEFLYTICPVFFSL